MQPFTFFISYRRRDTAPIALLLKYEIERRLQFVRVSVDVEDIAPGEHFPKRIERLIDEAHVTIALIGKMWMPGAEATPFEDAAQATSVDYVAIELERSLTAPLLQDENDRYGMTARELLPIFIDCIPSFAAFRVPDVLAPIKSANGLAIDHASWPSNIGPLLDRIAVRFRLEKRPDHDQYPTPSPTKARTNPISTDELSVILKFDDFSGWYVDNFGNADARYLAKTFKFPNFNRAAEFMRLVSDHCRILNHHPEWRNVFNHVTVALTTWDARRQVTIYDMNLALFMNKAAESLLR